MSDYITIDIEAPIPRFGMHVPHSDRNLPFVNQPLVSHRRTITDAFLPVINAGIEVGARYLGQHIPDLRTVTNTLVGVASYAVGSFNSSRPSKRRRKNSSQPFQHYPDERISYKNGSPIYL